MFNIILIYVVPTSEDRKRHIVRCWPMFNVLLLNRYVYV